MVRKALSVHLVCAITFAVMLPGAVLAAGPGEGGRPPELQAEELLFADVPMVVTAARRSQRLTEAPSAVDVITAEEIANWGALTLQQVLRLIPGIDVRTYGIYTDVYIRGSSDRPDRVLCLVDGRRINSAFDGSFRGDLPLTNVRRIEVVKGPGSALYGPNAFGGVINIITKRAQDIDGLTVSARAGSEKTWLAEVLAGKDFGGLEGVFTFRHGDTDGHRLVNDNDDRKEDDLFARVTFGGFSLSGGHDRVDQGIQGRIGRESPSDRLVDTSDFADLAWQHQWGDLGLELRASYNKRDNEFTLGGRPWESTSEVTGAETQGNWKLNASNFLTAGVDFRWDEAGQNGDDRRVRNAGVFVEYETKPLDALIFTLGGRYDDHSVYEDVFTPRLSAIYLAGDSTSLRASYGEAFRAPSIQDLYVDFYLSPTVHMVGNPDLKPEKLKTYELGVMHAFNHWVSGSLALFSTRATDLIQIQQVFSGGVLSNIPRNIGEAEMRGVEAGLKGSLGESVSLFVNYSYLDADDEDGKRLLYIPYNKFSGGILVTLLEGVGVDLTVRHVGERSGYDYDLKREVALESYTVADLTVRGRWKRYGAALSVYNLFDETYQETVGYPQPGRSVMATVTSSF